MPASAIPTYNWNPSPISGNGAFGKVPGPISPVTPSFASFTALGNPATVGMPDPFGDLSKLYPNLSGTNSQVSANIMRQLQGQISPATIGAIQDGAATWGASMGMPGSGLSLDYGLRSLGRTAEDLQQQGIANYNSVLPTISSTQTVSPAVQAQIGEFNAGAQNNAAQFNAAGQNALSQFNAGVGNQTNALNAEIAAQNAVNNAAPDPTEAASYAKQLFDQYLAKMSPAGGGFGYSIPGGLGFPSAGGGSYGGAFGGMGASGIGSSSLYNSLSANTVGRAGSGIYIPGAGMDTSIYRSPYTVF